MAERLDRAFPQFVEAKDGVKIPPQVQAQLDQLMQQHEQLTQIVQQQDQIIRSKALELSSKEKQVGLQEETKLAIAQLRAELEKMKTDQQVMTTNAQLAHDSLRAAEDREHQGREAGAQRQHAVEMTEIDQTQARAEQFTNMAHERGMAAEQRAAQMAAAAQPGPQPSQPAGGV
jgi:hypothetical protein